MRVEATTQTSQPRADAERRARSTRGQSAVWQARLILLVMINVAQLWILSAAVEAALARHYSTLVPLVVASGVCWLVALSVVFWWRPVSRRHTSTGYVRARKE
ncbi:MAG TPA: hypothetical protein VJT82_10310 [Pyrinomonadaceae bacterium]|nr:hypothetical protein [Pyrinomonadaceae bacterium]